MEKIRLEENTPKEFVCRSWEEEEEGMRAGETGWVVCCWLGGKEEESSEKTTEPKF